MISKSDVCVCAYTYILFIKYFWVGIQEVGSWWPMGGLAVETYYCIYFYHMLLDFFTMCLCYLHIKIKNFP